jgi:hypothetical protein
MREKGDAFVDEVTIPSRDDSQNAYKEFIAIYGAPAFVRRAREVEDALAQLLQRCRRQRDEWLLMVRLNLGILRGMAGEWSALRPVVASDDDLTILDRLHQELKPVLRSTVDVTSSQRRLRNVLREVCESLESFNRRWHAWVPTLDLTRVNELREGYNRYYLLEKECALRSARVAREGFVRLEPLTLDDVRTLLPLLPLPTLAS